MAVGLQPFHKVIHRHGSSVQKTLRLITTPIPKYLGLFFVFDTFSNDLHAQPVPQGHNHFSDACAGLAKEPRKMPMDMNSRAAAMVASVVRLVTCIAALLGYLRV